MLKVNTYKTVGDSESDGTDDGNTDNGEFDDRVSQERLSIRMIFVQ
jgi:hypothetical protein